MTFEIASFGVNMCYYREYSAVFSFLQIVFGITGQKISEKYTPPCIKLNEYGLVLAKKYFFRKKT